MDMHSKTIEYRLHRIFESTKDTQKQVNPEYILILIMSFRHQTESFKTKKES